MSRTARLAGLAAAPAAAVVLLALAAGGRPPAPAQATRAGVEALDEEARGILQELVQINTVEPRGSTEAARAMAERFRAAGFGAEDIELAGPSERKQNLVVRYRGTQRGKPLLLLAHLDVVEARREDWSTDPFTLIEKEGFYYGRGTIDMKDMAACWVTALLDLKRRGVRPARDIVLALTADEETGDQNGVEWLVANRREAVDAEFCLTEGGGGQIHDGRYTVYNLQAAEKVYVTFTLEALDAGGHSSMPRPGNPIFRLAIALGRLASLQLPVRLNEVTRGYFARMAAIEGGSIGLDMGRLVSGPSDEADAAARRLARLPYYNALLRSTCTATRVEGGHAENALPQTARAWINCRLLPDEDPAAVERALVEAVGDPEVKVARFGNPNPGPASPLLPEVVQAVERAVGSRWPGVPVVPVMVSGATDGRILRRAGVPTYGVGAFENIEDNRGHGRDERIGVRQFREERALLADLVTRLSAAPSR